MAQAYRYHRRVLQLLQWHCPPRLWHLKTPVHMFVARARSRSAYPDARFLWTHRDPAEVLGSVCSLIAYTRSWVSDRDDSAEIGEQQVELWSEALMRAVAFREQVGEERFADISWGELQSDPVPVLGRAYEKLGLEFSSRGRTPHGGVEGGQSAAGTRFSRVLTRRVRPVRRRRARALRLLSGPVRLAGIVTPLPPWRMRSGFSSRGRLRRPAGLVHGSMMIGQMERTFCSAVSPEAGAPLLVALHGAGSTGAGMAALTGLAERGPAAACTVVFPDGRGRVWNDERAAPSIARRSLVDDVGFIKRLIDLFLDERSGDSSAVFATGISNGALMSEHLARHSHVDLAGIALVAGTAAVTSRERAPVPLRGVRVLMFEGTADPLIPYGGGPIGPFGRMAARRAARTGRQPGRGIAAPAEQVAADWAAASCASPVLLVERWEPPGDLPVTRLAWSSAGREEVVLYRIEGGGHTWPGGPQYLPVSIIGGVVRGLDATGIILDLVCGTRS